MFRNRGAFAISGLLYLLHFGSFLGFPSGAFSAPVGLQNATATFSQTGCGTWLASQMINGNFGGGDGWAVYNGSPNTCLETTATSAQTAVFESVIDAGFPDGTLLTFNLFQSYDLFEPHNLGKFRLSATTDDRNNFADGLASGGDVTAAWITLMPQSAVATNGTILVINADNSILANGPNPAGEQYTITALTTLADITGFRLETLEDPTLPTGGPGRASFNGNFVITEFTVDQIPAPQTIPEPPILSLLLGTALGAVMALRHQRCRWGW